MATTADDVWRLLDELAAVPKETEADVTEHLERLSKFSLSG